MQKPTAGLSFQIINYLMQQSQVRILLDARDNNKRTFGVEVSCKFYKRNLADHSKSAYIVEFVYEVDSERLEKTDDVSMTVEVKEGNPPIFHIVNIRNY
jgi:hypothetical protein